MQMWHICAVIGIGMTTHSHYAQIPGWVSTVNALGACATGNVLGRMWRAIWMWQHPGGLSAAMFQGRGLVVCKDISFEKLCFLIMECAEWVRNIFLVNLIQTFWTRPKLRVLPMNCTTTDFLTIMQPRFMWQAGAVGLCPWLRSWLGHLDAVINAEKLLRSEATKPYLNRSNRQSYNI